MVKRALKERAAIHLGSRPAAKAAGVGERFLHRSSRTGTVFRSERVAAVAANVPEVETTQQAGISSGKRRSVPRYLYCQAGS